MASPSKLGPQRQDSAISSASSGNRTVRANSNPGRRRSSTSTSTATPTGLFARLTGKNRRKNDEDSSGSDVEDNSSVDASPTPLSGRVMKTRSMEDMAAGPSDYWRRPPSVRGSSKTLRARLKPEETPDAERDDNEEYELRIQSVLSLPALHVNGTRNNSLESRGAYVAISPRMASDEEGHGEDTGYREVVRLADERGTPGRVTGEEDFGALGVPLREEDSDRAPSDASFEANEQPGGRLGVREFGPNPMKSYPHPLVSRLRSHLRTTSSATQATQQSFSRPLAYSRTPSHFSQISLHSDSLSATSNAYPPNVASLVVPIIQRPDQSPFFAFQPLRQLSGHLFSRGPSGTVSLLRPPSSRKASSVLGLVIKRPVVVNGGEQTGFGKPTVLDVNGMVAVGTESGCVLVYGFGQEIKFILGYEGLGPVTAVTISSDKTYIAVGHASGNIHLYDISNPTKPARTTLALTLVQVLSGGKEGHLQGSRILHIGFVGARHTSIVTGDEHGRAFWWSLGKVVGMESNDVVRMLGSYPEQDAEGPPFPSKRPTTLYAALPLPLGNKSHPTDSFQLVALLSPTKLVVVGMKPQAKTWFRKMRQSTGGDMGAVMGCAQWLPSGKVDEVIRDASDPVLAYSWGTTVRFLRVRAVEKEADIMHAKGVPLETPKFVEANQWDAADLVQALQWFDQNHVVIITSDAIALLDVRSMTAVESTPFRTRHLTSQDSYFNLTMRAPNKELQDAVAWSVRCHREKLFLLTRTSLQVGSLLHWSDRILARVHQGDFLGAIQVALAYFEDRAQGNLIGLPAEVSDRRNVVGTRIRELMRASLEWAFSEDRMRDDTHYSVDGRGVDLTGLYEGLASTCIEACLSMDDVMFLFDDAYEHFANAGIRGLFLGLLEPYVFDGRIREVPPNIIQALLSIHDERGEYDQAEAVIWHVEPQTLDINQAVRLCEAHGLWDALIHVYTRAMGDYVAPLVKLIRVVRNVQRHRQYRPSHVGEKDEEDPESLAPDAYKLHAYMENVLSGLSYPRGEPLPDSGSHCARSEVYAFLFSVRDVIWPDGPDGELVLAADNQRSYPYLRLLLEFDTEAFLHAMDIAFEDSYLNDPGGAVSRQSIVNLMLDVMDPDDFHSGDVTFLHIFVARNLPKYTQFLFIPPANLHRILVSLASDPDQSTREDRQLAAEYLLSAYTPHDLDAMLALFEETGFFRILRASYRRDRKWTPLISTFLKDPEADEEVFANLDECIGDASTTSGVSSELMQAMIGALPHLFDLSVRQTALLLDKDLPSLHDRAIAELSSSEHRQMAYLRCLLEPSGDDQDEKGPLPLRHASSKDLGISARHTYVSLLCRYDPSTVISFLDAGIPGFFDLPRLADECENEGFYEGQLWALDRQGRTKETFDTVGDILRAKGTDLGQGIVSQETGTVHMALENLQSVSRMAIRLCQDHSAARTEPAEEMWFGVLHEMVELVHSVAAIAQPTARKSSIDGGLDELAIDALRSLVQETLQSLVSSSSQSLSFPRLFKRLVEASTSTSKAKKGRAYSEFRTILTGMLDSYRAEGDMLSTTSRLIQADLFLAVREVTERRQMGWRPVMDVCDSCGETMFTENSKGTKAHRPSVKVLGSGRVVHEACMEKEQEARSEEINTESEVHTPSRRST